MSTAGKQKKIAALQQAITTLQREKMELGAQLASAYHFASHELKHIGPNKLLASGVVVSFHVLGGRVAMTPVCIRGGLSADTVAALQRDMARSYRVAIEFTPVQPPTLPSEEPDVRTPRT